MEWSHLLFGIVETAVYSIIGIAMMGIGFFLVKLFTPFSIKKEIEEDQNVSLGIIIGALILGISIIVASVIVSPSSMASLAARSAMKAEVKAEAPIDKK